MSDHYDFMAMQTAPPDGAVCDFCASPDVHWSYPCRDHQRRVEHLNVVMGTAGELRTQPVDLDAFSSGGWAACNPCHALIERSDRVRLARRSAKRLIRSGAPIGLKAAIAHCRGIHDQFWSHRDGPAVYSAQRPLSDPTR
jgi:hypothetical protein